MTTSETLTIRRNEDPPLKVKLNWEEIIKNWELSEMSQSAFCKANGISYYSFVYYRTKKKDVKEIRSQFLPVKLSSNHATLSSNHFVLHYPNGKKLTIPQDAHPEIMTTLLSYLERF